MELCWIEEDVGLAGRVGSLATGTFHSLAPSFDRRRGIARYRGQEATPLVIDGVLYVSTAWTMSRHSTLRPAPELGLALGRDLSSPSVIGLHRLADRRTSFSYPDSSHRVTPTVNAAYAPEGSRAPRPVIAFGNSDSILVRDLHAGDPEPRGG
jgi:hypothetical protein